MEGGVWHGVCRGGEGEGHRLVSKSGAASRDVLMNL